VKINELTALQENVAVSANPFAEEFGKILCTALHCQTHRIFTSSNCRNNFVCKGRHHNSMDPIKFVPETAVLISRSTYTQKCIMG
jgi:hypothetical protein